MTKSDFRDALDTYCAVVGGSVSSYGRTDWHNAVVGGVPYSAHRFWLAADVRTWDHLDAAERHRARLYLGNPDAHPPTIHRNEREEIGARLGLRVLVEDDHDHLQPLDWKKG